MENKVKIFDEQRLKQYSLWLLSKREYSEKTIFEKMSKYQPDSKIIENTINYLKTNNYINDKRYTEQILYSYSKKESPEKTKNRLLQKGVPKDIINECIKNIRDNDTQEIQEIITCQTLLNKKFKEYDKDNYTKYSQFLARKGFKYSIISKAISLFKEDKTQ